ncbi:MAG: hypothetical protein QXJ23_10455 [Thermofilum sp.]|uniref:hypothetical protein n=1 Tax=Thermofilum sp. TaxID=1961369 RepID=UPI003168AED4
MAVTIAITMATTIQVSRRTRQLLEALKKKLSAKSYDEALQKLLAEKMGISTSMFGSNPKLSSFREEEEAEFHEL